MRHLRAEVVHTDFDCFPFVASIRFPLADGGTASVSDKWPVVAVHTPDPGTPHPLPLDLACVVQHDERDALGRAVATVELAHGVTDAAGNGVFVVPADQLTGTPETD
ncbi:hypothetical protein [Nocardia thailandica]|uniref:hypothetical protein n=1 Tax=Nocardia thailandica TaxID=257275 RepID=UPI000313FCC4|nr:hypothetical protein [Nocardia thailandica]